MLQVRLEKYKGKFKTDLGWCACTFKEIKQGDMNIPTQSHPINQ